jgi:hypothetical protein
VCPIVWPQARVDHLIDQRIGVPGLQQGLIGVYRVVHGIGAGHWESDDSH